METDVSHLGRKPYPSDVSGEEWSLVVPYLTLMKEDAPQPEHSMRELFNGLRCVIRYGIAWRAMPNDVPHWNAVHAQAHRGLAAETFEATAQDLLGYAAGGRTQGGPDCRDHRQPDAAFDAGERHPCRL
jgi:transposase